MDSDEEFLPFSESEKQPSPVPERRLKRLRKATEIFPKDPISSPSDDAASIHDENTSLFGNLDREERNEKDLEFEELNMRSLSPFEGFKEGNDLDSGFDSLNVEEGGSGSKRALEFDFLAEEFGGEGGDPMVTEEEVEVEGEFGELGTEEGENKRQKLDEEKEKKKKKRVKSSTDGYDEPYSAASTKRRGDKERRDHLKELRTESQRLLRETRNASFKPVPLVQKSVSSVLEKIRKRKLELAKKSVITNSNSFVDGNENISREVLDFDFENSAVKDAEDHKAAEADHEEATTRPVDVESSLGDSAQGSVGTSSDIHKNVISQMASDEDLKQTFRPPVDDTQDITFDSQTTESKDELSDEMPSSLLADVMTPSLLAMNLKFDSAPLDDSSSDEEDSNKENIDPRLQGSADLPSSPRGDPVKAFVDEEAEEDDSDNELSLLQDNEEDEDGMDAEEINDIIATGYEEKPIDNEMRNQLHQKWLEQQDAAGTENLLQRLKCSSKQKEMNLIEEREDEESEEAEEEFLDDPAEYLVPRNAVRMNLKKAKEMIPQMFTDKDDIYVSSDDEEIEKSLVKQSFSHKAEEKASFLSPAEREGSKEIFGLIKKLNGVPDTRRKAKMTSYFHMLSIGGNKTMSSKSSFMSRGSRSSLPVFQKHGSSTVRSFVFERDDSNSKSAVSMSEDSSDLVQKENRPKKTATAKFSNSQVRSNAPNTQSTAEKNSGPSLHEILRCPSLQSSHYSRGSMVGQVEAIYAAFKLDHNVVKKEPGVSIRTA
ncbi:midasin isoform X2 [Manihot esculenta]|uniref:DNA replication checkpoint mediator MRC1 domain-containing protein n=3 Tax=Manihot esculenta TaxID=3983 RepID=A0A2C9VWV6_MANES|nr:midasin isoform X2 [Manihot esculenta]KAG8654671.1 hypothetical protein MANES_05G161600v8 [Manihot esculenta]KAG8654672.1 hypothetical protein MANES_05G161600v8 [Manihot esculenta]OAY50767.1 hypothetical protein MANES_05G161600v8 [Manihot esculenta]